MPSYEPGNIIDYHYKLKNETLEYKGVIVWTNERYDSIEVAPLDTGGRPTKKLHVIPFGKVIRKDVLQELAAADKDLVATWIEERAQ